MFPQETIFAHFERVHTFALALVGIALFNLLTLRKPKRNIVALEKPSVSILIPARNEEHTITRCLQSLLAQDYPHFEVLVWDDCSTDKTRDILCTIHDKRFRWIAGTEPPPGWLGKSWACFNLAQYARGDLLIFTDADTWHEPSMVQTLVNEMLVHKLDALSGVAREETKTLGKSLLFLFLSGAWSHCIPTFYPSSSLAGALLQWETVRLWSFTKVCTGLLTDIEQCGKKWSKILNLLEFSDYVDTVTVSIISPRLYRVRCTKVSKRHFGVLPRVTFVLLEATSLFQALSGVGFFSTPYTPTGFCSANRSLTGHSSRLGQIASPGGWRVPLTASAPGPFS